jgi:hypothetical protein
MSDNYKLSDPYIIKLFRDEIKKIVEEELQTIQYDKVTQAVIASTPTKTGFADIVLNGVVGNLDMTKVIPNVRVRPGLRVKQNNEVYVKVLNSNTNNLCIDLVKNSFSSDLILSYLSITSTTTLQIYDCVIFANSTSGAITINLPDASKCSGKIYIFKKIDNTANAITVVPYGSQLIDGIANMAISTTYPKRWIISDGANWWIIMG